MRKDVEQIKSLVWTPIHELLQAHIADSDPDVDLNRVVDSFFKKLGFGKTRVEILSSDGTVKTVMPLAKGERVRIFSGNDLKLAYPEERIEDRATPVAKRAAGPQTKKTNDALGMLAQLESNFHGDFKVAWEDCMNLLGLKRRAVERLTYYGTLNPATWEYMQTHVDVLMSAISACRALPTWDELKSKEYHESESQRRFCMNRLRSYINNAIKWHREGENVASKTDADFLSCEKN